MNLIPPSLRWSDFRSFVSVATACTVCALATSHINAAVTVTTLYSFQGTDGAHPHASLLQGNDGNFYGTTSGDSTDNNGTIFSITPAGAFTLLHVFSGSDGAAPQGTLIQDAADNFYGTTFSGGAFGYGTIFQLTPSGNLTTLHSFTGGKDGEFPSGGLVEGDDGDFYGSTEDGGTHNFGTIFRLSSTGVFKTLHQFTIDEGASPNALIRGNDGKLYGTALSGGADGYGTVFAVTLKGSLTILHSFNGDNGSNPLAPLTQAANGDLYGTTDFECSVFKITTAGDFTSLYTFSSIDGEDAQGPLLLGNDGNIYGTTQEGGTSGSGTVFLVTPAGALAPIHDFFAGDTGGAQPTGGLVLGPDGNFYGTTSFGGTSDDGTIFKITITPTPATFFVGEVPLTNNVFYLSFPSIGGYPFGYYTYLSDIDYIYHYDLGYEYVIDAKDSQNGVYFYDFASSGFLYTSPLLPFPYLYDFNLNSMVYYYPSLGGGGRYNTDGIRYFYVFSTGQIITM